MSDPSTGGEDPSPASLPDEILPFAGPVPGRRNRLLGIGLAVIPIAVLIIVVILMLLIRYDNLPSLFSYFS